MKIFFKSPKKWYRGDKVYFRLDLWEDVVPVGVTEAYKDPLPPATEEEMFTYEAEAMDEEIECDQYMTEVKNPQSVLAQNSGSSRRMEPESNILITYFLVL